MAATDLLTIPGAPQEVLLSQNEWLTLYNDAGAVNHIPNDGICCYAKPDFGSIAQSGNPLTIYGFALSADGKLLSDGKPDPLLTQPIGANYGGNDTTGSQVIFDGTLLYTSADRSGIQQHKLRLESYP